MTSSSTEWRKRAGARPAPAARLALLVLPALLLGSRPGSAATPARKARADAIFPREAVESLSLEQRTTPLSLSEFRGLSKSEAEVVFGASQAAVYAQKGGVVYVLASSSAPRAVRALLARRPSLAPADPWAKARFLRTTTVEAFASTVNSLLPGLTRGAYGAYLTKFPYTLELPAAAAASLPKGPAARPARPAAPRTPGTVLSETFETDPFASRWAQTSLDGDGGTIEWGWTTCDAHAGSHSIDGVRGGTTGSAIGCASAYPANQFNLINYTTFLDLTGASTQAWMEVFMNMLTENNPNNDFVGILFRDPLHISQLHGFRYSGDQAGAWWRFLFNLKEWTPHLDLTLHDDNVLAIVFGSNATTQSGFGARVDDLTITTDTTPGMTCNAAVDIAYGQVPLSVTLTGSTTGGTGSPTFIWDPLDGSSQVAGQVLMHTYTVPGEYQPDMFATDTVGGVITRCTASVHVTAARSATGGDRPNDVCSAAKVIPTNSFSEAFSAVGYTQDPDEPQPCGPAIGATAWYKFVAPSTGTALISLCSSNYDTVLGVYTGSCGSFSTRGCNDDDASCGGNPAASKLTHVQMTNGTTYWIQVGASGGYGSQPGNAQIDFTFTPGVNGDADGNGIVNGLDVVYLINYIFAGGLAPLGPVDANGDGNINGLDIVYLINYIFAGGPAPVP